MPTKTVIIGIINIDLGARGRRIFNTSFREIIFEGEIERKTARIPTRRITRGTTRRGRRIFRIARRITRGIPIRFGKR